MAGDACLAGLMLVAFVLPSDLAAESDEDPAAFRLASLLAGVGILLVGAGALALVRPWGLGFPAGW